jgi:hypothetical protein
VGEAKEYLEADPPARISDIAILLKAGRQAIYRRVERDAGTAAIDPKRSAAPAAAQVSPHTTHRHAKANQCPFPYMQNYDVNVNEKVMNVI